MQIKIQKVVENKDKICELVLRSLPDWFGIEQAILDYIQEVQSQTMFAAYFDGDLAGFISVKEHNSSSSEIFVMGVMPAFHRKGIGANLVEAVEKDLLSRGAKFLNVKTLAPSAENEFYAKTRLFYEAMSFHPIEELSDYWNKDNPCLLMAKHLTESAGRLHHVELYVSDLKKTMKFWSWFLSEFNYKLVAEFEGGQSWQLGETYLVFVQTEDKYLDIPYHRRRTGLNHLAFHGRSKEQVDEITQKLRAEGITILYEDRHPYAGGSNYYAVFFEDPDRFKVEVVAP